MKCKKCGVEIEKGTKVCPNCGEVVTKKNSLPIVIIGSIILVISILIIVCTLLIPKFDSKNYDNYEKILENSASIYLFATKIILEPNTTNIMTLDYMKDLLDEKYNKCDGYVVITTPEEKLSSVTPTAYLVYDYKGYVKCGFYKTEGYDSNYSKKDDLKIAKEEVKEDKKEEASENNVYSEEHKKISEITEDSVNKQLHETNFMTMLYYTLGNCVEKTSLMDCQIPLNKTKKYLVDTNDRIEFVGNYYASESDSNSYDVQNVPTMESCYSITKFNELYSKTFGENLDKNKLSNYIATKNDNYVCTPEANGMGMASYTFTAPKKATSKNDEYVLPVDLINLEKVDSSKIYTDGYNLIVPKNEYSSDAVYTTMYIKYKKLSDGSKVLNSIEFNK